MVTVFIPQTSPSRICSYSKTAAHQYFVSRKTELYLKYGCNLNGLFVCWIGQGMYLLCYHHYQRVIQWNKETVASFFGIGSMFALISNQPATSIFENPWFFIGGLSGLVGIILLIKVIASRKIQEAYHFSASME